MVMVVVEVKMTTTVMFGRRCRGCTNLFIGLEDAACGLFRCSPSGARYALLNAI
jgi:hypothetical protein